MPDVINNQNTNELILQCKKALSDNLKNIMKKKRDR